MKLYFRRPSRLLIPWIAEKSTAGNALLFPVGKLSHVRITLRSPAVNFHFPLDLLSTVGLSQQYRSYWTWIPPITPSSRKRSLSSTTDRMAVKLVDQNISKKIIESVDAVLFDCDGVLWDGHGAIEGSLDTVLKLKQLGKKVFYVTNNSSKSRQEYLDKCKDLGFPAQMGEILCTAYVAAAYLKQIKFEGKVYLMGKAESIGAELEKVGIQYYGPGPDPLNGVVDEWLKMEVDDEVKCVVVGFDPHISYMKLMKAATFLKNPNCLFVATNTDPFLPSQGKVVVPGTGCMVLPVAHAARREPIIVGKPAANMFEVLSKAHNLSAERCLMVGDSLNTDMKFAKKCGMQSLLVLSGVSSLQDVQSQKDKPPTVPDFYAPVLADFGKFL